MIRGSKEVRIKEYLFIDRMGEGLGYTKPEDGEELWGLPAGYIEDSSQPFIEHRKAGKTIQSVNCADVAVIVFDV
jgi:hypothetical protein